MKLTNLRPKIILFLISKQGSKFILQQDILPPFQMTNFIFVSAFSVSFYLEQNSRRRVSCIFPHFVPKIGCLFVPITGSIQPTSVREDALECGMHFQAQSSREERNFLAYESRVSVCLVQLGTTQVKTSGGNSGMVEETMRQYRSISAREALDLRIHGLQ